MGKSDVSSGPATIEMAEKSRPKVFSIGCSQVYPREEKKPKNEFPPGIELLANQVAGHMHNGTSIGMFKHNGAVLKPITKPRNGQMEIDFYEELEKSQDDIVLELKQFVPKYLGYKTITLNNKEVKCIVLEDLTKDFKEPCIMDIKIGKRTWDPSATYEKIIGEDNKYSGTKRDLGLCVPGFLVYRVSTGRVCRFGKEYGKNLDSESIKDALKIFMNGDARLSRDLLLQFLVELWRILRWIRKQKRFRFFSSSLLFIYDAKRLKQFFTNNVAAPKNDLSTCKRFCLYKPLSLMKLNDDCPCTGFSGQFTKDGPILHSTPSAKLSRISSMTENYSKHPMQKTLNKLRRVHSFQNNYDKDLQKMRTDYTCMLDGLVDDDDQGSEMWATVKMIDFAHVFPSEHNEIDRNYLEGIENLIKIFEEFLSETVSE